MIPDYPSPQEPTSIGASLSFKEESGYSVTMAVNLILALEQIPVLLLYALSATSFL